MSNPLDIVSQKIDEIKQDLERKIEIALHREFAALHLSRLAELDPDNASEYTQALQVIGKQ